MDRLANTSDLASDLNSLPVEVRDLCELSESQLALVGGGIGDTVL
jgi:hypothetical protein